MFQGTGEVERYQVKIHVDEIVAQVVQNPRLIPFSLRAKVDGKLQQLVEMDVIEPVDGPTPWVSPIVVVPKPNGEIRLCVDIRRANEAVIRERHPIPTIEVVLGSLNGSIVFSKLDLK